MTISVPSREDFEIWLEHPITQFVLAGMAALAVRQEGVWKGVAWNTEPGGIDPIDHAKCRANAQAYSDLANITYDDALGANDAEEPAT